MSPSIATASYYVCSQHLSQLPPLLRPVLNVQCVCLRLPLYLESWCLVCFSVLAYLCMCLRLCLSTCRSIDEIPCDASLSRQRRLWFAGDMLNLQPDDNVVVGVVVVVGNCDDKHGGGLSYSMPRSSGVHRFYSSVRRSGFCPGRITLLHSICVWCSIPVLRQNVFIQFSPDFV